MATPPRIALERPTAVSATRPVDSLRELTGINLDDLVASAGWQDRPHLAAALRRLFHAQAQKFARQMLHFDAMVGEHDLVVGARAALRNYVRDVRVFGRENLPAGGPVIVLANHPGLSDTLALFAAIDRPDLRIIAVDRPFLRSLPNVTGHLFYVSEQAAHRIAAVKRTSSHLRGGGAVLTFPAGEIEPDPAVYPGSVESLVRWTDSAAVFLRFAPQAVIVPAVLRNVVWDKVAHSAALRLKRDRADRERLAAALQLLSHLVLRTRPITVTVQFGAPVGVAEAGSSSMEVIHARVLDGMRELLANAPQSEGESVM